MPKTISQPSEILDRTPPYSEVAERAVVGSCLLVPELLDDLILEVSHEDFHDHACGVFFRELSAMHSEGKRIDDKILVVRVQKSGDLKGLRLGEVLADIMDGVGSPATARDLAVEVRDKAIKRKLLKAGMSIMQDCWDERIDGKDLVAQAEQRIFAATESLVHKSNAADFGDVLQEAMAQINAREGGKIPEGAVSTGLTDLDGKLGGLKAGSLNILAGRPSMGKSALAAQLALHVAMVEKKPVYFASLEMSKTELAERLLCSKARVNGHKARTGFIQPADTQRMLDACSEIGGCPLVIDDATGPRVGVIGAMARRLKRKQGLGLIVIDYLQLVEPDSGKEPRQEQVAKIARRLKGMARDLNVPVLCLAQLNRQAEMGTDHRPKLSHLRESGAIEQDADVVMFVHREEYYAANQIAKDELKGQAEIIVAKHRNGPTGGVPCTWLEDYTLFANVARMEPSGYAFKPDDYLETVPYFDN